MRVCIHCGTNLTWQRVWPSGTWRWVDIHAIVSGAFCPAVMGEAHLPARHRRDVLA